MLHIRKRLRPSNYSQQSNKPEEKSGIKIVPIILLIIILVSSITSLPILQTTDVSAITTADNKKGLDGINWRIKSYIYYKTIASCFQNSNLSSTGAWGQHIAYSDASGNAWFRQNGVLSSVERVLTLDNNAFKGTKVTIDDYMNSANIGASHGLIDCGSTQFISDALNNIWGLSTVTVLCNSNFYRDSGIKDKQTVADCVANDGLGGDFYPRANVSDSFANYIKKTIYGDSEPSLNNADLYIYYINSLKNSCIPGIANSPANTGNETYQGVPYVNTSDPSNPKIDINGYSGSPDNVVVDAGHVISYDLISLAIGVFSGNGVAKCSDIVAELSKKDDQGNYIYAQEYLKLYKESTPKEQQQSSTVVTGSSDQSTCGIPGVGWIICPVVTFLGSVSTVAFSFLANNLLVTHTSLLNTDPNNGSVATYSAWQIMRNFANVAFVIVFMVIIFSQITNYGIDNYGIKKMLPRLVIAAILVNVSFFICQIAIDLSNILGYSIKGIFDSMQHLIAVTDTSKQASFSGMDITAIVAVAIAGTVGLVVGGVALVLSITVPVLLAVLVAVLMTVLILVARTALIVLLVVISPLAFVAYVLPKTTDKLFGKWYKMFQGLLLVFPIVSLLFGAGNLAAYIISVSNANDTVMQLFALAVAVVPLFAVPMVLKGSLNSIDGIGKTLSGWSDKANSRIGKEAKETSRLGTGWTDAMNYRKNQRNIKLSKSRAGYSGLNKMIGGAKYAEYASKRGGELEDQEFEEQVKAAGISQQLMSSDDRWFIARGYDKEGNVVKSTDAERVSAIRDMMTNGNFKERKAILESAETASAKGRLAMTKGYFAKGDQQYYGAALAGDIASGKVNLADAMRDNVIAKGKISAQTLVSDADATSDMLKVLESMDDNKEYATGQQDSNGKEIMELGSVIKANIANRAKVAYTTPGASDKITTLIDKSLQPISNLDSKPPSAPPSP